MIMQSLERLMAEDIVDALTSFHKFESSRWEQRFYCQSPKSKNDLPKITWEVWIGNSQTCPSQPWAVLCSTHDCKVRSSSKWILGKLMISIRHSTFASKVLDEAFLIIMLNAKWDIETLSPIRSLLCPAHYSSVFLCNIKLWVCGLTL